MQTVPTLVNSQKVKMTAWTGADLCWKRQFCIGLGKGREGWEGRLFLLWCRRVQWLAVPQNGEGSLKIIQWCCGSMQHLFKIPQRSSKRFGGKNAMKWACMDVHGRLTNIDQTMFCIGTRPFDNHIKTTHKDTRIHRIAETGSKMFLHQFGTALLVQTRAELCSLDTKWTCDRLCGLAWICMYISKIIQHVN